MALRINELQRFSINNMNREKFINELTLAYEDLFKNDAEYAYSASKTTPKVLAEKMTVGLIGGTANHEGAGVKRACKAVGIKHTLKAIRQFLT